MRSGGIPTAGRARGRRSSRGGNSRYRHTGVRIAHALLTPTLDFCRLRSAVTAMPSAKLSARQKAKGCANFVFAAAGFLLMACNPEPPPPTEPLVETVTSPEDASVPAPPDLPIPVPPSTEGVVQRVEGLMISRPSDRPGAIVIHASGLVSSRGWSNPRLVPAGTDEARATFSLSFVATSPERQTPAGEPQPVEALIEFSTLAPGIEMVRIIGATNELIAPVNNYP